MLGRGRPPTRTLAVLVAVLALLPACGTKRSVALAAAAADERERASAVSPEDGPGVTATEVRVGFVLLELEKLSKTLGFTLPESGDLEAQIQAIADDVNERGGIAGRRMVPVVRRYEALTDSQANEEKLCTAFTQDDKVFAVVLQGQFQSNARPCYARARTLMLDTTAFSVEQSTFDELAPYLWQPSYPEYGELSAALVADLDQAGFFDGRKLGVVGIDSPQNRAVYDDDIAAELAAVGVEAEVVRWIDPSSSATLQTGQDQAVSAFKAADVDRLLVVGGQRLAAFMMTTAQKQNWYPAFALTTFDQPDFGIRNYPDSMVGALGVSLSAGFDVGDDQLEWPATAGERRCKEVLERTGDRFPARANARQGLLYCDAAWLLRDAFAGSEGPVNAEAFREGVVALGDRFEPAAAYAAEFGPGRYAGAVGFRRMRYGRDCNCMELVGDTRTFEGR